MGLAEVKADIKLARERLLKLPADKLDVRTELTENVLPIFDGICDAIEKRFAEVEEDVGDLGDAVDEMIDQQGDMLHPETATRIVGVVEIGKLLATELEPLLAKADEVTKKRVRTLIKSYRQGAEVVLAMIAEITIPLDPDEPTEGEPPQEPEPQDGKEGDDDDEDEDDDDPNELAAEGGAP